MTLEEKEKLLQHAVDTIAKPIMNELEDVGSKALTEALILGVSFVKFEYVDGNLVISNCTMEQEIERLVNTIAK